MAESSLRALGQQDSQAIPDTDIGGPQSVGQLVGKIFQIPEGIADQDSSA
jgi:hypothetical protein